MEESLDLEEAISEADDDETGVINEEFINIEDDQNDLTLYICIPKFMGTLLILRILNLKLISYPWMLQNINLEQKMKTKVKYIN